MATTTLEVLRQEFAGWLGYGSLVGRDNDDWDTTTNITTDTHVISTDLRDYGFDDLDASGSGDDALENLWILITGSNNSRVVRRIKAYDASAGDITCTGTNFSSESGAVSFELHRHNPFVLEDCLNRARRVAFPQLHLPVSRSLFSVNGQARYEVPSAIIGKPRSIWLYSGVENTIANNILSNPGFEDWTSSTADSWSATTLDIAQESATSTPKNYAVLRDGSSIRCTSRSSSTGTLLQSISSPTTHSGQRISLMVWVYCLTADIVSTEIKIGSTANLGTAADGGLHSGSGWELLTHYEDSTVTISSLDVGISVVSSATDNTEFYVDDAVCVVGPTQEPEHSQRQLFDWEYVPIVQGTTLRNEVVFPYRLPDLSLLRFEGQGYLSAVTTESGTLEIGAPQTDLLYAYAALELYRRSGQLTPDSDGALENRQLRLAERDLGRLSVHSMPMPRQKLNIPGWVP
jgi:hypothetical protein